MILKFNRIHYSPVDALHYVTRFCIIINNYLWTKMLLVWRNFKIALEILKI